MAKKTKKTTKRNTHGNTETSSARDLASIVNRTAAQDRAHSRSRALENKTSGATSPRADDQDQRRHSTNYDGARSSYDGRRLSGRATDDKTDNATSSERGPNRGQRTPSQITPPKRDAPFFLK